MRNHKFARVDSTEDKCVRSAGLIPINQHFLSFSLPRLIKLYKKQAIENIFLAHFRYCKMHKIVRASGGFAPWSPTRALPWTHWGAYSAPRPPAVKGNDLWSLQIGPTARCVPTIHLQGGSHFFRPSLRGGSPFFDLFQREGQEFLNNLNF